MLGPAERKSLYNFFSFVHSFSLFNFLAVVLEIISHDWLDVCSDFDCTPSISHPINYSKWMEEPLECFRRHSAFYRMDLELISKFCVSKQNSNRFIKPTNIGTPAKHSYSQNIFAICLWICRCVGMCALLENLDGNSNITPTKNGSKYAGRRRCEGFFKS